ncbi:phage tail protein [Pseudomonas triclosanedens]|uniref:Phage tail protein n=1 Tax=Pseudomonas triclosanedens TaxID=2961893 RepID=A0ABY6ZZP7_9PSED|nr:phage tail protein [Pseudomonas triclosanedens]WAI50264.1 phage tail protein [Pseudomonas triclosanedens]
MAATYFVLLTSLGASRLATATATGTTLKLTHMGVGDGGGIVPVPEAGRTALVSEKRRAEISRLSVDPKNPQQIIVEQVIPEEIGGWWIREMGLYDESGALIAYANCAPTYKPMLVEGSGRSQTIRMILAVDSTGSVELKIDPSVVLATREYVDSAIVTAMNRLDYKQSVRAATTVNISLSGLQTVDGVVLATGDRVLVKSQSTGSQNGIYVAGGGAWARSADADENAEVTPALTVSVESGTTQADSVWQLITDAPIVIGTTGLVFQDITNGLARLASPAFTGVPSAPTALLGTNTQQLATTAFVQDALRARQQRFTSSGSFTVPNGVTTLYLSGCGGGSGGGGGGGFVASGSGGGGGGGAGQSAIKVPVNVSPGQVIAVTIGAGGSLGAGGAPGANGVAGSAGGVTSFGSLLTLAGGSPSSGGNAIYGNGGAGGIGGTYGGGYGGDGRGFGGDGGDGGSGPFGTGGGGGRAGANTGFIGVPGYGYGTGGAGGGAAYNSGSGAPGTAGLPGLLIVEW